VKDPVAREQRSFEEQKTREKPAEEGASFCKEREGTAKERDIFVGKRSYQYLQSKAHNRERSIQGERSQSKKERQQERLARLRRSRGHEA